MSFLTQNKKIIASKRDAIIFLHFRVIGQKELVKTAVVVENSTAAAVISFFKKDTGWTKRVGKIA